MNAINTKLERKPMNSLVHLSKTYRQLRQIAGYTLIGAPLLILVAAAYFIEPTIWPTLSHYYFIEQHPGLVRTLFTGFLILVGGLLIAYRGFDNRDNWIHNIAGIFAICVALFPKRCDSDEPYCTSGLLNFLHMPSAVLVFLFAAWAVSYGGGNKLKERLQDGEILTLKVAKYVGLLLMSLGVVLYGASRVSPAVRDFKITILIVELLGFFGFAIHWLVMTSVIDKANQRIRHKHEASKPRIAAAGDSPQPSQAGDDEELLLKMIP
jgi:hypothetical protein